MIKSVKLVQPYLIKKLESKTIKAVLDSPFQTAYRLYILINDIIELQHFYEDSNDDFIINGTVKTVAAPAGKAKEQIWAIMHLQPILLKKPRYIIKCSIVNKKTNKDVIRFVNETKSKKQVYLDIEHCIKLIKETCNTAEKK